MDANTFLGTGGVGGLAGLIVEALKRASLLPDKFSGLVTIVIGALIALVLAVSGNYGSVTGNNPVLAIIVGAWSGAAWEGSTNVVTNVAPKKP